MNELNPSFLQAYELVTKTLSGSVLALPGIEAPVELQGERSVTIGSQVDPFSYRDVPPPWCSTTTLSEELQAYIADQNANGVGVARTAMDAVSKQTQFLLDLQRHVARKSVPRIEKIARAALRRQAQAKPTGPYAQFRDAVLQDLADSNALYV